MIGNKAEIITDPVLDHAPSPLEAEDLVLQTTVMSVTRASTVHNVVEGGEIPDRIHALDPGLALDRAHLDETHVPGLVVVVEWKVHDEVANGRGKRKLKSKSSGRK